MTNLQENEGSKDFCGSLSRTGGKMASKPRRTPDHISFIIIGILSLAGSQVIEGITWPIGVLFRAIFLAMAFFSCSIAVYLYDRFRKK